MTDLEKAIRYLCLFETDDPTAKESRYNDIFDMVHNGNEEKIKKYVIKYHKILDLLSY